MQLISLQKNMVFSAGEWVDTLTNVSMGDLLSESHNTEVNSNEFSFPIGSIPFSCDSFDAAIAAHIRKHQNKPDLQQSLASHGPSIWDAEETCDAFAFQKTSAFCDQDRNTCLNDSIVARQHATVLSPSASHKEVEV